MSICCASRGRECDSSEPTTPGSLRPYGLELSTAKRRTTSPVPPGRISGPQIRKTASDGVLRYIPLLGNGTHRSARILINNVMDLLCGFRRHNDVWSQRMLLSLGRGCSVSARGLKLSPDLKKKKNEIPAHVQKGDDPGMAVLRADSDKHSRYFFPFPVLKQVISCESQSHDRLQIGRASHC